VVKLHLHITFTWKIQIISVLIFWKAKVSLYNKIYQKSRNNKLLEATPKYRNNDTSTKNLENKLYEEERNINC